MKYRTAEARTDDYGIIVRVLMLSGQRRNEIASLHSAYVEGNVVMLPEELSKNHQEHAYPLCSLARSLLPQREGLFFPAKARGTPTNHWSECKEDFDKECPIAPWPLRDLRRTFATKLASLPVAPHIVERILNRRLGTLQAGGYRCFRRSDEIKAHYLLAAEPWCTMVRVLIGISCRKNGTSASGNQASQRVSE